MTYASLAVLVQREDPWSEHARVLLDESAATIALYTGSSGQSRFLYSDVSSTRGCLLVARTARGEPVGCGAIKRFDYGIAEVVCLYSRLPNAGIGRSVLARLETTAANAGYHTIMVDTSRTTLAGKRFFWRMGFEPASSGSGVAGIEHGIFLEKAVA